MDNVLADIIMQKVSYLRARGFICFLDCDIHWYKAWKRYSNPYNKNYESCSASPIFLKFILPLNWMVNLGVIQLGASYKCAVNSATKSVKIIFLIKIF